MPHRISVPDRIQAEPAQQLICICGPIFPSCWLQSAPSSSQVVFKIITSLKTCLDSIFSKFIYLANKALYNMRLTPLPLSCFLLRLPLGSGHTELLSQFPVPSSARPTGFLFVSPLFTPYHFPGQFMFIKPNLLYLLQGSLPNPDPSLF